MAKDQNQPKQPDAVDKLVGRRVRARRREIGMSQEVLAKQLGVTFQQLQKYEKGANRVSVGRLVELASALDTTVADLLDGIEVLDEIQRQHGKGRGEGSIDAKLVDVVVAYLDADTPALRGAILDCVEKATKAAKRIPR